MAARSALCLCTALTIAVVASAAAAGPPDGAGNSQRQLANASDVVLFSDDPVAVQLHVSNDLTNRVRREAVAEREPPAHAFDHHRGKHRLERRRKIRPRPKRRMIPRTRTKRPRYRMPRLRVKPKKKRKYHSRPQDKYRPHHRFTRPTPPPRY